MRPLYLHNARVLTMDAARPVARTVTIAGERVVTLDHSVPVGASVMDCGGGVLVPGFIDPHVHLLAAAAARVSIDCSPAAVSSIEAIGHRLAAEASRLPPDAWLRAVGYDETGLAEGRHPTRWELDAAVPDRPVRLVHRSGHAAVLNSRALALAGISIDSEEPPGGVIDRRIEDGEPTGLLIDMDATVERAVPPLAEEQLTAGMRALSDEMVAAGVSAVQDLTHRNDAGRLALLDRICDAAGFRPARLPSATAPGVSGAGPLKLMLPEAAGLDLHVAGTLAGAVRDAHLKGRQVAIHAITEAAVRFALEAVEAANAAVPRPDHRHRIEHAAVCPPALAERAARLGVVVVSNPAFLVEGADRYQHTIPPHELPYLYAAGDLARAGVSVAAASDTPFGAPAPLTGVTGAIERRSASGVKLPGEGMTGERALEMVTCTAAFAAFAEREAGTIASGRRADLVLLDEMPRPGFRPRVILTILAGKIINSSQDRALDRRGVL